MDRDELLNVFLDTQKESDEQTIFKIEKFISQSFPYKHKEKTLPDATMVNIEEVLPKFETKNSIGGLNKSQRAELFEKTFSKRELAILLLAKSEELKKK